MADPFIPRETCTATGGDCFREGRCLGNCAPAAMSRECRAMLLNVLWHHQGGSSPVGQSLRKVLGIGQYAHLTDEQLSEAKWIDRLLADAVRKTPDGVPASSGGQQ
jgi:hypothetical protein